MRHLILSVMLCVIVTGCVDSGRLSSVLDPGRVEEDVGPDNVKNFRGIVIVPDSATFQAKMKASALDPTNSMVAEIYLQAGIALSDELCALWFRKLGAAQAKVSADRDALSNIGALSAVILGLSDVNSAIVGGVAGGFGFLESTFNSEMANFIVSPDVGEVQYAIDLERAIVASDLEQRSLNFYQARRALIRYDNSCSHLALRRFVNQSVRTTRTAELRQARGDEQFAAVVMSKVSSELEEIFEGPVVIGTAEVLALHAIFNRSDVPDEILGSFVEILRDGGILNESTELALKQGQTAAQVRELLRRANRAGNLDRGLDKVLARANMERESATTPEGEVPVTPEGEVPAVPDG